MINLITADIDPVSIIRYELDVMYLKLKNFDYRTATKEFKVKTVIDVNSEETNVIVEDNKKQVPIGVEFNHKKYFYKNILLNAGEKRRSMKVIHNKDEEKIEYVTIKFDEHRSFNIPINPLCTGVQYSDESVTIYRTSDKKKLKTYTVFPGDGIYEESENEINFTKLNNDEEDPGLVELRDFIYPSVDISRDICSINYLPTVVTAEDNFAINLGYNIYGIMENIDDDRFPCYYYKYAHDGIITYLSSHKLFNDNFDIANHFSLDNDLNVYELFIIAGDKVTFMQFTYKGELIDEKEPQKFEDLVRKYFNY